LVFAFLFFSCLLQVTVKEEATTAAEREKKGIDLGQNLFKKYKMLTSFY